MHWKRVKRQVKTIKQVGQHHSTNSKFKLSNIQTIKQVKTVGQLTVWIGCLAAW